MNGILEQLDEFFNAQKDQEQKAFFFLPILLFGFLSYYFIYPMTNEKLDTLQATNEKTLQNIDKTTQNNGSLSVSNQKLKKDLKNNQKKLDQLAKEKGTIKTSIDKIKFARINLKKWAEFYNNIPDLAKQNNLELLAINNHLIENEKELKDRLNNIKNKVKELAFQALSLKKQYSLEQDKMNKELLMYKMKSISKELQAKTKEVQNLYKNIEEKNKFIGQDIELEMDLKGSFVNFIKFINVFEAQKLLVRIRAFEIDKGNLHLVVDIYGAKI